MNRFHVGEKGATVKGMTKVISMHVEGGSVWIHGGEVAIYFTG